MRKIFISFSIFCYLFIVPILSSVRAEYVLPYPSFMPGNKIYTIARIIDSIKRYWYFGNISKVKYHLGLSDKYLVEAKTLFEYKQYLLGVDALKRTTKQFQTLPLYVKQAKLEHKDMNAFILTISEAAVIHRSVLNEMKISSPESFQWVPEKASSSDLLLHNELDNAIGTVQAVVNEIEQ